MNTLKKTGCIIAISLAGIALIASCSKEPVAAGDNKAKKVYTAIKTNDISPPEKSSLSAIRNGQYVTLNWHIEVTDGKLKQIGIMRNSTGIGGQKHEGKVAELDSDAISYKDCLPDENAHWYWLKLVSTDGRFQEIGPIRVESDKAGSTHYIKIEDIYNVSVTRTDDLATLKWDFPENEYKIIEVFRFTHSLAKPIVEIKNGTHAVKTMERKSQYTDALPDANLDYWYLFRITMKSGTIIDRGPIKAEYAGQ